MAKSEAAVMATRYGTVGQRDAGPHRRGLLAGCGHASNLLRVARRGRAASHSPLPRMSMWMGVTRKSAVDKSVLGNKEEAVGRDPSGYHVMIRARAPGGEHAGPSERV